MIQQKNRSSTAHHINFNVYVCVCICMLKPSKKNKNQYFLQWKIDIQDGTLKRKNIERI